ncbi:MAG TPA: DUF177 domain-containing protein [Thermoanaerobacterales bacterium]|nr:DUF177 domain-containing protein [Thermoanaerobacterales bacterium]
MKINLARMKQIVGSISEFEFKKQNLDVDLKREGIKTIGPVKVKGKIENLGDRILQASGQIEVDAQGLCSRCLTQTQIRLLIDFSLKFSDMITNVESEEEDIIPFTGDEIDLYPQVVNEVILNWPGQILCKTDCKGLCPNCGANLNTTACKCKREHIDPRLAVLKQLLKSE